jgi:hypothetical protein
LPKLSAFPLAELFAADDIFKDVNSVDKTLMEKISLIDSLEQKRKKLASLPCLMHW